MSCGRRGFWQVTHASTDRRRGTNVSPSWFKARCARSSARRKSSRTRCATIWNVAMPSSSRRWRRLCALYREVQVLKKAAAKSRKAIKRVAIVSYDEKPEIQAIATTTPDLPPKARRPRHLCAGLRVQTSWHAEPVGRKSTCLPGRSVALVRDRHRSREFIEFLKRLDAAYPAGTAIKLILDNHSAHISRETRAWLDARPSGRFQFTSDPSMVRGSISSKASSPNSPGRSCATSGSPQNTSSKSALWPASTT